MCLEEQQATFTAQICTDWTSPHASGFTSNRTTLRTNCLRSGECLLFILEVRVQVVNWGLQRQFRLIKCLIYVCNVQGSLERRGKKGVL